jgi:DNA-binding transcriptional LysR family regulator
MISELELWRCFEATARLGSFRRAARELSLTGRVLRYRIGRLEHTLGVALFTQTADRAVVTADGVQRLPQACRLLAQAAPFDRGRAVAVPIELAVGAPLDLGVSWLARSFERLHAQRPERTLRINLGDDHDLVDKVRQGALDCAVAHLLPPGGGLVREVLHREHYLLVGATGLIRKRRLSQRVHASAHVLVDIAEDLPLFRYLLEALGETEPWPFASVEIFDTTDAIRARILQGTGVAVLPHHVVARDLRVRSLKHLLQDVELRHETLALVWRDDHPRDRDIRRLAADLARAPLR